MSGPPPERLLTRPLIAFLVVVAGVLVWAGIERLRQPDLETAIRELADGDLEGPYPIRSDKAKGARVRRLELVVELGAASDSPRGRWAGLLAAVALDDRAAYDVAVERLGGGPVPSDLPHPDHRGFLDLGDPVLSHLAEALWAEALRERDVARRRWLQVVAQGRFAPRPLAVELAREYLERHLEAEVRVLAESGREAGDPGVRAQRLELLVELGAVSRSERGRWAGLLAAVALANRSAYHAAVERLGGAPVPTVVPLPDQRAFLDLGDPVLAHLAAALWAEAATDRDTARARWRQALAGGELVPLPFVVELAAAALERLR
ncbi:MAG: hypothetical protein NXI31_07840 [bacterium]|nr:hypothetical protein [bacterium]